MKLKTLLLLSLLVGYSSCKKDTNPPSPPTQDDGKGMDIAGFENEKIREYLTKENAVVVDVRYKSLYDADRYRKITSIHILLADMGVPGRVDYDAILGTDKSRYIIVHCASRAFGTQGANYVRAAGYTNVVDAGTLEDLRKITGYN